MKPETYKLLISIMLIGIGAGIFTNLFSGWMDISASWKILAGILLVVFGIKLLKRSKK